MTAKAIDRMVLLGATVCMAAHQYSVPSEDFWSKILTGHSYLAVGLIVVIGVFGAFTPVQTYTGRGSIERSSALRQQIHTHYGKILEIVVRSTPGVELGDLGLHIWQVRRSPQYLLRGRLVRLATYRMGSTPATRSFAPVKGVGVIGLCWKRNEEVAVNVEQLDADLDNEMKFEAFRASAGSDAVMGLGWVEFQRIHHRGAVFASPVRNRASRFIGCISVDTKTGFTSINIPNFWHELNSLCFELGQSGFEHV